MRHLDLFSGIGGFTIAGLRTWGDDYECVGFCDNNKYCRELLKLRFPGVPIFNDIRELNCETFANARCIGQTEQKFKTAGAEQCVDLITGGFPCQPFSAAGKRKGTDDDRHLWPQMFRVISEFKPRWVIAENVRGILTIEQGLVFQQVCLDLESIGYEVQPFVIPAVAVNAPHRRDRIWIVAHSTSEGRKLRERGEGDCTRGEKGIFGRNDSNAPDTNPTGQPDRSEQCGGQSASGGEGERGSCGEPRLPAQRQGREDTGRGGGETTTDTRNKGLERWVEKRTGHGGFPYRERSDERRSWDKNWLEVATEFCGVYDGLPAELDGFKLSKAGHRVERLKGLGNAIVPQVAEMIMKAIKETDYEMRSRV